MKISYKKCKVDVVSVQVKSTKDNWNFEELLTSKELSKTDISIKNKIINLEIIENTQDYIIGFVRSEIDKELPAKINKATKIISPLDVDDEHAITYGNVFLFAKQTNVLFYEINRNSIYLDDFRDLIYRAFSNSPTTKLKDSSFSIVFGTIFRKKEYERALSMELYKKFKLKVHQPQELLKAIKSKKTDLGSKIRQEFCEEIEYASKYNCDIAEIVYNVEKPKTNGGLNQKMISGTINLLKDLLKHSEIRDHIDIIEICGYSQDSDSAITPVNLIGDVYSSYFKIEVPRLDTDLQKSERIEKIETLFHKEIQILKTFI